MTKKLKAIFDLYQLIHDKDIFLREYETLTAYRLINETSSNRQAEELFLVELSQEGGFDNLKRVKQMFVDIDNSERLLGEMVLSSRESFVGIKQENKHDFDLNQHEKLPTRGTVFFDAD